MGWFHMIHNIMLVHTCIDIGLHINRYCKCKGKYSIGDYIVSSPMRAVFIYIKEKINSSFYLFNEEKN